VQKEYHVKKAEEEKEMNEMWEPHAKEEGQI